MVFMLDKSQLKEIMRNPCEFDIYLINVAAWDTFRLSKLTSNYISKVYEH